MSERAVLGPVDPQLGQQPAASILKVLRQKPIAEVDDQTLILADQAGKAVAPAPRTGNRVNQEKAYLSRPDYHDSGLEVGFFGRKDPQAAFVRRINVTSG
jgi:hypothetical protein